MELMFVIGLIATLTSVTSAVVLLWLRARSPKRFIRVQGRDLEFANDAEIKQAVAHLLNHIRVRE